MPEINVALIGRGFMGKAHSNAYRQVRKFFPGKLIPRMKVLCGKACTEELEETARLYGWEESDCEWERGAALTSRLRSFETELLTQEGNLDGLTLINRDSSPATVVWSHAGQDCSASLASGLGEPPPGRISNNERARGGKAPEESVERGADSPLVILRNGEIGPLRSRWKLPTLKTRLVIACGGG